MSTLYFLSSFLIFLVLLTSSINSSTLEQTNATVTDVLIRGICNQTRNPSLCLNKLNPLKGKSLAPNPVAALGSNTMNMIQSRANRTVALTWAHYRGTTVYKPELRAKYYKCFLKYTDVMNQLREANRYMLGGTPKFVKKYMLIALDRVNSCDLELIKPPRDQSAILEANGKFRDLSSIILSICDKVPRLNEFNWN